MVMAVRINGREVSDFAHLARAGDGKLFAPADLLREWRLRAPAEKTLSFGGITYYSLDALKGATWKIDDVQQTLVLNVPTTAFSTTVLDASYRDAPEAARPDPGWFLNHQLVFGRQGQVSQLGGLFEAGFFSKLGVLTSEFAARDLISGFAPIRLETKLVREYPGRMATLTIGDSTSAMNTWSRQVTYAGVRWASDFSTQPAFVPIVLPNLNGQATQPSAVDIFINGVRTSHQQVDSGPFSIQNVPVITGQGDVQMVVTDVLGRQQITTQSYVSARELLRQGVNEYAYEAGTLRRNFGTSSGQYGSVFAEGTQRHGFSNHFTMDGRFELSGRQQTAGMGAEFGVLPFGILGGGVAASHSGLGSGGLGYVVMQHRARRLGYSGSLQIASSTFQQLGMIAGERAPRVQAQFQVSHSLGNRGSVSAGYLRRENRAFVDAVQPVPPDFSGFTTSFNARIGARLSLTASFNLSRSFKDANSGIISLILPIGPRELVAATGNFQQSGDHSGTIDYIRQLPIGTGYGYRLRTNYSDGQGLDAGVTYQNDEGAIQLEASEKNGTFSSRITETGSLVAMHGHVMPSRWLTNSFAIVDVPATPGVRVFANNQYIAKTSWRGLAVLPVLAPYNRNTIRLDDKGVPIDVDIDLAEATVVPMSRSGVFLEFKAQDVTGALIRLVTENGEPIPVGAEVTVPGSKAVYIVALRGEVFMPDVKLPVHLNVRWAGHHCEANVTNNKTAEPLPTIGPVSCLTLRTLTDAR